MLSQSVEVVAPDVAPLAAPPVLDPPTAVPLLAAGLD